MIMLDRILIKDQKNSYISIEPNEVLTEAKKHYRKAFKTRDSNFNLLSED